MNHLLLSRYGADIPLPAATPTTVDLPIGGLTQTIPGVVSGQVLTADVTVHASALSLAQQIARADVCRRLAGG